MTIKRKPIKAIKKDKNGKIISFNLAADAANDDWSRAARLKKKADEGDKEARKRLEEMGGKKIYIEGEE